MPQLSIQADPAPAYEGQIAYPMLPRVVVTRFVDQAGGIAYGRACVRAANQTVKLGTVTGDVTNAFQGFAVRQEYKEQLPDGSGPGYPDKEPIAVLRRGFIWVAVEGAVTEETPVFARTAASGGNTTIGAIRGDADSANATLIPNARFITSTTAAGLAIVEVW
jgi:hypothetical protein